MSAQVMVRGPGFEDHLYDLAGKSLARDVVDWGPASGTRRHEYFGQPLAGASGGNCENWRFPAVEAQWQPGLTALENLEWNEVTFIYRMTSDTEPAVFVAGLPEPGLRMLPLERVADSLYLAVTVRLPAARAYRYSLVVDGVVQPDPLNPQREKLINGEEVSVFFTQRCFEPVVLERWEMTLLKRLTNHILPFQAREGELFLSNPGGGSMSSLAPQLHHLDHSIGVVNYIDKMLAREERHHLPAYKTCLAEINRILRGRNPYLEPRNMDRKEYERLHGEMADGNVPGWDYTKYSNPGFFLFLLRRHVWTGAFSHPKYGGNAAGRAWDWLNNLLGNKFDYGAALEPPYGYNLQYRG